MGGGTVTVAGWVSGVSHSAASPSAPASHTCGGGGVAGTATATVAGWVSGVSFNPGGGGEGGGRGRGQSKGQRQQQH